jgi:hypothetical protein
MWRTSQGDRTLEGAEAELFRLGVVALAKRIRGRLLGDYFSRMTANERLCALAHIATALLDPSVPCPENRAWSESTIYAVFTILHRSRRRSKKIQALIAAVAEQHHFDEEHDPDNPPAADDIDCRLEGIADLILWDRDWEDEDEMCDSEELEGYFDPQPPATPQRVKEARAYLEKLTRTKAK